MSPSAGDVSTPEPKPSSGFVNVLKSLTGTRSPKIPNSQSLSIPPQAGEGSSLRPTAYGGPPNCESLYEKLKAGNPLPDRIAAAESLCHAIKDYPLTGVTSIFKRAKDLIEPINPSKARTVGYELLTLCVQQTTSTDPERLWYFSVLTAPTNPEDFYLQLRSFVKLAKDGRDLGGFHNETLPLLTSWLRQNFDIVSSARKQNKNQKKGKAIPQEEKSLALLYDLIIDIIKFNFKLSTEQTIGDLIEVVLHICVHTTQTGDLRYCIQVMEAIVIYGDIPCGKLIECVKVLCAIHCLVDEVQPDAWRLISNLCRSHNGDKTVIILLEILRNPPRETSNGKLGLREIRGSLSVIDKLFAKDGENGYPPVPFTLLINSLLKVSDIRHLPVENDVMRLVLSLLHSEGQEMKESVMDEDWSSMFCVVTKCATRALEDLANQSAIGPSPVRISMGQEEMENATSLVQNLHNIILRVEALLAQFSGSLFFQRDNCVKFLVTMHRHLPESCATLVIDHYTQCRYCYPSELEWERNIKMILSSFYGDRTQPTKIRLQSLKVVTDVFEVIEMIDGDEDLDMIEIFVRPILEDVADEKDISVLQAVMAFAVAVADSTMDQQLFQYVVNAFSVVITNDRLQSSINTPSALRQHFSIINMPDSSACPNNQIQTPSNVVTKALVQIFMRSMDKSTVKARRVFVDLLDIVQSHDCQADARITALKMLCRLRADWANRIFLTSFTESDGLAASLYRTPASLSRKQAADEATQQQRLSRGEDLNASRLSRSTSFGQGNPQVRHVVRTSSSTQRTLQRSHQMWMEPDLDSLPEQPTAKASPLLVSIMSSESLTASQRDGKPDSEPFEINITGIESNQRLEMDDKQVNLDIPLYLKTLIDLIQNGCDWEVYSYIIVHLSSQLTNQALFRAAIPQIKMLREVLCDQIKSSTVQDPPISSGLRKSDVAICFFQILNMVMSYHSYFSKSDQDEIVRTFLQGVGERTSKCCIHSLSICCHELPGSISKVLVTILTKMSQIITQSHVAVHILEFLACLARMPNLYVNFREEEYRIVFAICFRYLQYVRDQQAKENQNRNSNFYSRNFLASSEASRSSQDSNFAESNFHFSTSDDLPQYVYALAYHVIIFWFLCLKLADRAGQVSWITKNLCSIDVNGKEEIDEQAQITLDFMQRVAYADVDESDGDPSFTEEAFGEIKKKRWIVGNSIITIQQATRGDWAQITKRQPSGTSCYIIQEKFTRPPPHQTQILTDVVKDARYSDDNVKLPSHLLVQMCASIPLTGASMRPIPLPNDDAMERAIKNFNRTFTVDGHKVGVIYIGENQTNEAEILSNVHGSSDYNQFLSGLGTLTKLRGASFNTRGLDRQGDSDGEYTFCWRDRVTEIIFHVTTQMPTNLEHDPHCNNKKRHIGNDFVNIIFNNSGLPFKFNTFPSEYNYVNIVITPESRASFVSRHHHSGLDNAFYKVQVMCKPGFPEVSPAAETKIMSLSALPGFIRLLALNASVFSLVWANREGGEHVSSWRTRLREINKLRQKYGPKHSNSTTASPPGTANGMVAESKPVRDSLNSLRRSSVANFLTSGTEPTSQRSSILSVVDTEAGGNASEDSLADGLDFSKWA